MDNHTKEQRRRNMQAVRNKDSNIEKKLRQELWARGLRYRKNCPTVFGKPDIAFIGRKIAVFCDSEFWHGYDWENKKNNIKSRRDFWWPKIEKNMQRDKKVTEQLTAEGWLVIRFWGDEIKKQPIRCADIVEEAIRKR